MRTSDSTRWPDALSARAALWSGLIACDHLAKTRNGALSCSLEFDLVCRLVRYVGMRFVRYDWNFVMVRYGRLNSYSRLVKLQ